MAGNRPHLLKRNNTHLDVEQMRLTAKKGDLLLADEALPLADYIVYKTPFGEEGFSLGFLQSYLNFLELIILNERIIVSSYDIYQKTDSAIIKSDAFYKTLTRFDPVFDDFLDIERDAFQLLIDHNILFPADIEHQEISPLNIVMKNFPFSSKIEQSFTETEEWVRKIDNDVELVETIATLDICEKFGIPLYLSEIARQSGIPFMLSSVQAANLSQIENFEIGLQQNVISKLKESLDEGAKVELQRLETLGIRTIFPETPISWQIFCEANEPGDFVHIALELRDHYKKFREEMSRLELELVSEDTNLQRKIKLLNQLQLLASELWPEEAIGLRKETAELSGLISLLPMALGDLSVGGVAKITKFLLSRPADQILKALRKRKIRVLLHAKQDFLKSKNWVNKLVSIFSVSRELIIRSLHKP